MSKLGKEERDALSALHSCKFAEVNFNQKASIDAYIKDLEKRAEVRDTLAAGLRYKSEVLSFAELLTL